MGLNIKNKREQSDCRWTQIRPYSFLKRKRTKKIERLEGSYEVGSNKNEEGRLKNKV